MKSSQKLPLILLVGLCSCSSVVVVNDDAEESQPEEPAECEPFEDVSPAIHQIDGVTSAALFGDVLHVDGAVDGQSTYALIDLARDDSVLEVREDLIGQAHWIHVEDGRYFRLLGERLEVAEAGDRLTVVSSSTLPGAIPDGFATALGVADGQIHLCLTSTIDAEARVVSVPSDSLDEYAPRDGLYCNGWFGSRGAAAGSFWVTFGAENPPNGSDGVAMWDLGNIEDPSIESHGYNVDGVHHYGYIRELETDGTVAVASLENQSYVFLYYREGPSHVVYSTFGSGEKKLLAVIDQTAYVARELGATIQVSAYDLHDRANIAPLDYAVSLEGAAGGLTSITSVAHDSARLVLTDERGAVYVVPLQNTPASVTRLTATTPNPPGECPR